mmetsp:Transcript_15775/g.40036  ORF Transcript_15775/g.40036 Transcript_15775/m.40036 type:complete len:205 (-) Transcript_15775:102-716(-)|eukprot:5618598-Prymnesium_polylepis.1
MDDVGSPVQDGLDTSLTGMVVVLLLLVIGGVIVAYRQGKRAGAREVVDNMFQAPMEDRIASVIADTHTSMMRKAEVGEIDLAELGPTRWVDMPCVTLVAILERLLTLGTEAVDADDVRGAVTAYTEGLQIYGQCFEGQLRESPAPLQSAVFRLLTHRSGAYVVLGKTVAAADDAKEAKEISSWDTAEAEDRHAEDWVDPDKGED